MQKRALIFLAALSLTGCGLPGVYKLNIQQGNVIEQDMIDKLKPGMTKRQVRFVMGTPLIVDTFTQDRWDYVYTYQPGGGERKQEQVALFFEDDKLTHFVGHYRPSSQLPAAETAVDDEDEGEGMPTEKLQAEEEEKGFFDFLRF